MPIYISFVTFNVAVPELGALSFSKFHPPIIIICDQYKMCEAV
jgi:hypothetical protein